MEGGNLVRPLDTITPPLPLLSEVDGDFTEVVLHRVLIEYGYNERKMSVRTSGHSPVVSSDALLVFNFQGSTTIAFSQAGNRFLMLTKSFTRSFHIEHAMAIYVARQQVPDSKARPAP